MNSRTLFTTFRTIKIEGACTGKEEDMAAAIEEAVAKIINDARAHILIIEKGVQITDITDQGEAI